MTGVPAPKLSFYKGDNLLTANDNFAFNYGRGVMTIKKAEVGYEGEYSCVAENPVGESRMKTKIELLSKYVRTYQNQLRNEKVLFIRRKSLKHTAIIFAIFLKGNCKSCAYCKILMISSLFG